MSTAERTNQPLSLREAMQQEAERLFTTLPPAMAERCREEYVRGAMEVHNRQAGVKVLSSTQASEASTSTTGPAGGQTTRSLPSTRTVLPATSPLVAPIQAREAARLLTDLCYELGREVNRDRMNRLYQRLQTIGWTAAEFEYACALIPSDKDLCKTVSYDSNVGPGVFAEAKERPQVMRGRLHDYATAVAMSQEQNRPLSQCFEAVHVDGEEGTRWMML